MIIQKYDVQFALVFLFALALHLNYTALSQSESSNFLMYIITKIRMKCKPPLQNKILVQLRGTFQNFRRAACPLYMGVRGIQFNTFVVLEDLFS